MSAEPQAEQSGPTAAGTAQGERVDLDLEAIKERAEEAADEMGDHVEGTKENGGYLNRCAACFLRWPCREAVVQASSDDVLPLLAAVAALRGQLAEARGQSEAMEGRAITVGNWLEAAISAYREARTHRTGRQHVNAMADLSRDLFAALAALDPSGQRGGAGK